MSDNSNSVTCEAHGDRQAAFVCQHLPVFSDGGKPRVVADIVFVGSVSTRSNTWLWSWANDSYLENVKSRMREVRQYGAKHRLLQLAAAHWSATEQDGW